MTKRILAAVLWFVSIGYLWALIATVIGISTAPAALVGATAAVLIAGDPFGRIWRVDARA